MEITNTAIDVLELYSLIGNADYGKRQWCKQISQFDAPKPNLIKNLKQR
jgi:hypothetical protein